VVAFSARAVTEDVQGAKYVNSPETAIFRKSAVLYGFSLARKAAREAGAVILCEGQLDVIAMYRAGFKNSVAPQGTAFTDEQATKLKRFAGTLYLAFDSDTAGIKATVRAVELALDAGFDSLKIIEFPAGGDPDEILKKEGAAAIAKLVKKAPDFFSYLIKCFSGQYDVSTPAGKGRLVGELVNYIARVRNSVARASYASSAAAALGVPETAVFQELNRFKNKKRFYGNKTSYREPEATEISEVVSQPESIVDAEKELLRIVLAHGTSAEKLSSQLPHEMISKTPVGRALEKVIQLTMNGEWEFAEEALLKNGGGPDPLVTEILAENSEISKEYQQKALSDCVKTIKSYYVQTQIDEIKRQLPLTNAPETKKELLRKFTEHTRKLAEIRQNPV
jgi:DNA primase